MSTVSAPVERRVILHNVSWETYQRLLNEHPDESGTHFIYNEGELEIMVLSARHEVPNRDLADLVTFLSVALGIRLRSIGSMTYQREDLQKGFEPDSAFYIAHAAEVEAGEIDAATAPPPDLIIEVDVTSSSLPRLPIFAAFRVPEVWRHENGRVFIYQLEQSGYVEARSSLAFPPLTAELATRFLEDRKRLDNIAWAHAIQDWARQQL